MATDAWYCWYEQTEYGPYTWDQMVSMATHGQLAPESPVRRASDPQWYPAASVPGLMGQHAHPGQPAVGTTAAPRKPVHDEGDEEAANAGKSIYLLAGGVGVVALLAIVLVTVMTRPRTPTVAEGGTAVADAGTALPQPADASGTATPASATDAQTTPEPPAPETPADRLATRTRDLARQVRRYTKNPGLVLAKVASVRLGGAWLEPAPEGGQLIKVQVQLTNVAMDQTLEYSSWSGGGAVGDDAMALATTDDGTPLTPRHSPANGNRSIGPSQTTTEVLAFAIPAGEFQAVRLMLPKQAIGRTTEPFGFEIEHQALLAGARPAGVPAPAATTVAGATPPGAAPSPEAASPEAAPAAASDDPPAAADAPPMPEGDAAAPANPAPANQPDPDFDDVTAQIRRLKEQESKAKEEGQDAPAAPTPENPAPAPPSTAPTPPAPDPAAPAAPTPTAPPTAAPAPAPSPKAE